VSAAEPTLYLEDLEPGEVGTFGSYVASEAEILEFSERYNPLPYHLAGDEGSGPFGGMIATGWQTGAIMMRIATDHWTSKMETLGGTGIEARFHHPLRAGDEVRLRIEVTDVSPSERDPGRGTVRWQGRLYNQDDKLVMTTNFIMRVARRPAPAASPAGSA
jgi:acyl dehydratase